MSALTELQERLAQTFAVEFGERLRALERDLLALEAGADGTAREGLVGSLLREAHSLKGAAQVVGQSEVGALAHAMESRLEEMRADRNPGESPLQPLFDALEVLTALEDPAQAGPVEVGPIIDRLGASTRLADPSETSTRTEQPASPAAGRRSAGAKRAGPARAPRTASATPAASTLWTPPAEPPADVGAAAQPAARETSPVPDGEAVVARAADAAGAGSIRIRTEHLDALLARGSELAAARDRAASRQGELRLVRRSVAEWRRDWQRVRGDVARLTAAARGDPGVREVVAFAADAGRRLERLERDLAGAVAAGSVDRGRLAALADGLGTELLDLRLVPVATLFDRFPWMVRDLARASGKRVELRQVGWETEIDRQLLERLMDPVMHLLRNAVDHGIEPEAERVASGKPPVGMVVLEASQRGSGIRIEVSDDGRGIDPERVRHAAIDAGVPEIELPPASDLAGILRLVLRPGVSTASHVSEVSGRGVGLDIVRDAVVRVGGTIEVASQPGGGTRVGLQLPLTLVLVDVVVVGVGDRRYALPMASVERCVRVVPGELTEVSGRPALQIGGGPVVLADLGELLGGRPVGAGGDGPRIAVVMKAGDERVGLLVDVVRSAIRVVVKGLGALLESTGGSPLVAGAAIIGDEELMLVLDPGELVQAATTNRSGSPVRVHQEPAMNVLRPVSILVVDDSVTTRTLEKSILEAAGFAVAVASFGLEALAALRREHVDLVVSDVDMPRLDGFELTRRIKADPKTRDLPVVLVTALDAPEQQEQGLDAGADAYLLKHTFDQRVLLETIHRLVG
ncbi:MAG: response regulator [Chloroflexota bacterium]